MNKQNPNGADRLKGGNRKKLVLCSLGLGLTTLLWPVATAKAAVHGFNFLNPMTSTHRTLTLILDFSTCVSPPDNPNIFNCQELDATGKPAGTIKVTVSSIINTDGTCATNPLCSFTDHARYEYTLDGGTITVADAIEWQGQTTVTDESGNAAYLGFSKGPITDGSGKYQNISGTLTMRWDMNICICLFDLDEA